MRKVLYLLLLGVVIWGCQSEGNNSWKPLDLLAHGLPITVEAPDSTTVKASDLGILQDVTLEGVSDADYFIQIYASKANTTDIAQIKADQVSMIRSNPYFTQIVEEEENGFIYETMIDSTNYYSFQYVYLQGDKEYIFTTGLAKTFDLMQVEKMYASVKQGN